MIKLTDEIKRMLNSLAYANEAEYLPLSKKGRVLAGGTAPTPTLEPAPIQKSGPQVGLYLGSELPEDVMAYVIQTCIRLKHGLTVLTFQSEMDAQNLLKPYQTQMQEAGIRVQLATLSGEPPAALVHALRKRAEIAFLICSESGYLGRGLIKGIIRQDAFPVPVVMVAPSDAAVSKPEQTDSAPAAARAA